MHEIKHDGIRIIARSDGRRVRLYSRHGDDLTGRYPLIVQSMARLHPCTIDGEAVACDDNGVPSFDLLRDGKSDARVFLYAFDLIELRGEDRRRDPLDRRKADLARLLADAWVPGLVLNKPIGTEDDDGATAFEQACRLGLEGIVSKRKDSRYVSGRSPYWVKMTNPAGEAVRRTAQDC